MERRRFLIGTAGVIGASAIPHTASATTAPRTSIRVIVESARADFRASDYRAMAARLLPLTARSDSILAALTGTRRDFAVGDYSLAYSLLSQWHIKAGDDTAAGQTAERALDLARQSGSPIAVADAAQRVSVVQRRAGAFTAATDLVIDTAHELGADNGDPDADVLAAYGSLLASASYAHAQAGNAPAAVAYAELAEEAAARMRHPAWPGTFAADFSTDQTRLYRIGVHHALGQDAQALTWAAQIVPARLPNAERASRFRLDAARASQSYGRPDLALAHLLAAERLAPQDVRRPSAKGLVTEMLSGPRVAGLSEYARRIGVAV